MPVVALGWADRMTDSGVRFLSLSAERVKAGEL